MDWCSHERSKIGLEVLIRTRKAPSIDTSDITRSEEGLGNTLTQSKATAKKTEFHSLLLHSKVETHSLGNASVGRL